MLLPVLLASLLLGTSPGTARSPVSAVRQPPSGAGTTFDTTYYVTNRERRDGRLRREPADSLEFGLVITRFVDRPVPSVAARVFGDISLRIVDSVRLSRADFGDLIRRSDARAGSRGEGAVLYVHGYGVSFERGLRQGAEIAHRGRFGGPLVVFSWPAHDVVATWPSAGALISRAYRDDSAAAARSASAFRAALQELLSATRPRTFTVVGHSLGAQLVAEALRGGSAVRDSLERAPLRALVFFAPDIAASRFRDSLSAPLVMLARRRIVYSSSADRMLALSRMMNHSARAGQALGATSLAAADVEVVDITSGRRAAGVLRALVEPQHAMRLASAALYDFFNGVVRGLPPGCRDTAGLAARDGARSWHLTAAAIPLSLATCTAADGN